MTQQSFRMKFKKQPSSLFNTCIRYVSRNLKIYKDNDCLELFPPLIKNAIIVNVTRVQKGFHDDDLLALLMNNSLLKINLCTSTITDRTLMDLAVKSRNLKSLTLTQGNYKFTYDGFVQTIPKLQKLQQIAIRNSDIIDDHIVELISQHCPDIDLIDLEFCTNITDKSADHVKHLKLTKLNFAHTQITDNFLKELAKHDCGSHLEELNVSYCKITGEGLGMLRWDKIQYIGFEGCDIDANLIDLEFIRMNKNLKYIQWSISN